MPSEAQVYDARSDVLRLEEVVAVVRAFAAAGVHRVRLTGGEPTLRRGLVRLVSDLSELPVGETAAGRRVTVTMTTNGERFATLAKPLAEAGLAGVTVSLDTLDPDRFRALTRRGDVHNVRASISAAQEAGIRSIKLNTVALRGFNDGELLQIAQYAWAHDVVPRFIELMPMGSGSLFAPGELMPAADVRAAVAPEGAVADAGQGVAGLGPATYWKVAQGADSGRRFGTIAAMTENFCASCNRLRLSTTGQLHGCLARDDTGDLRSALRSGDPGGLARVVATVLGTKRDTHGFKLDGTGGPTKAMVAIGG